MSNSFPPFLLFCYSLLILSTNCFGPVSPVCQTCARRVPDMCLMGHQRHDSRIA